MPGTLNFVGVDGALGDIGVGIEFEIGFDVGIDEGDEGDAVDAVDAVDADAVGSIDSLFISRGLTSCSSFFGSIIVGEVVFGCFI